MSSFSQWLVGLSETADTHGKGLGLLGPDFDALRDSIKQRRDKNEIYFRIAFGLSALLAIATVSAALWKGEGYVSAVFGLTTAVAVGKTMDSWREKQRFDDMLDIALVLDESALRTVLEILIKKYA
jgi:hypothetical protein